MNSKEAERQYWLTTLIKIVRPVLSALADQKLKATMPVEGIGDPRHDRGHFSHLEALARTLTGLAPWLECPSLSGEEEQKRREYCNYARKALDSATDPQSADFVNFSFSFQPIVDAAFLCQAILRAPHELWDKLEDRVKINLIKALQATRTRKPCFNNWLLFSALIEATLFRLGADWDPMRIDYALQQHEQWYRGDGTYSDGPEFHWDYYNSYVIQPMLVDLIAIVGSQYPEWAQLQPAILQRARRYAAILERLISPEGTFPAFGRSLSYRTGAFQHLAQMALQHNLPESIAPAQVRCALTAVIQRTLEAPDTFDAASWLTVGLCGHQPSIGEPYISTGSLYLCSTVFLPLGLPPHDPFWSDPPCSWTAKQIWSGQNIPCDHALDD